MEGIRTNHEQIAAWVGQGARVLDLGCGGGALLALLAHERAVDGLGLEIDEERVARCVEAGHAVVQADIEGGMDLFGDASFDCVVLSQTLQELRDPTRVLQEMLRVGRQAIVSIANAGHVSTRLSMLLGKVPATEGVTTKVLQRLLTIADFEKLCARGDLRILRRRYLGDRGETRRAWLAREAVYLLGHAG